MTNAEITLKKCRQNADDGKLTVWEFDFVKQFSGWDKKQLRKLSYKQYKTLETISEK